VLAAELLQYVVNDALHQGHLRLPLDQPSADFPIIQYADDTILILEADINQITHLKGLLQKFTASTGLAVNYAKSSMVPINVHPERLKLLSAVFWLGHRVNAFHLLGSPHGYYKAKDG